LYNIAKYAFKELLERVRTMPASHWQSFSYDGNLQKFLANEADRILNDQFQLFGVLIPGIIGVVPAWFAGREVADWATTDYGVSS